MTYKNAELLDIYDREVRQACEWTRMRHEVLPNVVRHVLEGIGMGGGFVSWSRLSAENADAEIEAQAAYFRSLKSDFEWKVYSHDTPTDLPQHLLAHGFSGDEPEALMVADMEDLPAEYWTLDLSRVERVTTFEAIDDLVRMENEVWGKDISGIGKGMKYDLEHHPDHLSVFVVREGGQVLSAAWTHYLLPTSFASFWGGSTLKEYRRQGFYTALLAARVREARERGYKFLTVDASPDSRPILEKHGFRCLGFSMPYEWVFKTDQDRENSST
jgi:GNAT superfamily N-acetyltransferase